MDSMKFCYSVKSSWISWSYIWNLMKWNHFCFSKIVLHFMKSMMKWYNTKDQTCVYTCTIYTYMHHQTYMCTTKYHQNIRATQLAFPLYSMKHQVKMRDLCWISGFCMFSGAFHEKCNALILTWSFIEYRGKAS